jgi:hypothetical protein
LLLTAVVLSEGNRHHDRENNDDEQDLMDEVSSEEQSIESVHHRENRRHKNDGSGAPSPKLVAEGIAKVYSDQKIPQANWYPMALLSQQMTRHPEALDGILKEDKVTDADVQSIIVAEGADPIKYSPLDKIRAQVICMLYHLFGIPKKDWAPMVKQFYVEISDEKKLQGELRAQGLTDAYIDTLSPAFDEPSRRTNRLGHRKLRY